MVDISPDRHSVEIGRRGLQSIGRARAFLDRELLKGKTPRLRRAKKAEEDEEAEEEEMAASGGASNNLLQDIESAAGLFFVVEERSGAGHGPRPGGMAATSNGDAVEAASSGGASPPSPHSSRNAAGSREGSTKKGEFGSGGGGGGDADDDADNHDGGGSARAAAEDDDYSVPYWGVLRVGDSTNDPGDKPEPWPLRGGAVSDSARGEQQAPGPAISRSQLPPPSQVHRPTNVPDSVGYRIVVINVKVSIHHPRGSEVAANKDAVIGGVMRVRERQIYIYRGVGGEVKRERDRGVWVGRGKRSEGEEQKEGDERRRRRDKVTVRAAEWLSPPIWCWRYCCIHMIFDRSCLLSCLGQM